MLVDLKIILFGTRLVSKYGERTNQILMRENNNCINNNMKLIQERTFVSVREMFISTSAMYSHVEHLEEDNRLSTTSGLYIPMSKNSLKTNMILGYVENSYR